MEHPLEHDNARCGTYAEMASVLTDAGYPGPEIVRVLAGYYGGQTVYFQQPASLDRAARDTHIQNEFTGDNHRELARTYGLSVNRIRDIVGPKRTTGAARPGEPTQGRLPGIG